LEGLRLALDIKVVVLNQCEVLLQGSNVDTDPRHSGGMLGAIGRTLWLEGMLGGLKKKLQTHQAYQRARKALEYLEAGNEVMDKYRPIHPQDLALSGDVVEEQRLGQRNDTLAMVWCIGQ